MVADVTAGIGYVCQNITNFGGDPNRWENKQMHFSWGKVGFELSKNEVWAV
jgi:hypothetical protein